MNRFKVGLGIYLAIWVALGIVVARRASAQTGPSQQPGLRVFVDPRSGEFVDPPAASPAAPPRRAAVVRVAPGTSAAGGVVAEIPESLGVETHVSVQPDGRVSTDCRQGPAPEH